LEKEIIMPDVTGALGTVVLVHGGFVDASGWEDVYKILKKDGYNVSVVQNPTSSLADDVAATKRALAGQKAPVILVGHSYGGVVVTEAGNDPRVAGLVYIAAFAPDKGESVAALIKDPQPGAPVPPILPRRTAIFFSIGQSSPPLSQATWPKKRPSSWPTRSFPGAWKPSTGPSANQRGRPSRAGTWSQPRTR